MLCWIASACADGIVINGVQVGPPAEGGEGWLMKGGPTASTLSNVNGRSRIEIQRVEQVPPAETQAFAKWLRELKTTQPAEMEITKAAELEQRGLKGVMAEGTAKAEDGKPLRLRIMVFPTADKAAMLTAIIREDDTEKLKQQFDELLKSVGAPDARPGAPAQRVPQPVQRAPDPDSEARARMMLGVLEQEAARLGKEGKPKAATELSAKVARWQDELAGRELAVRAEPELHLVGVYAGLFPNGPKKFGTAKVQVDIKDRPVVLVLSAYESVRWELTVGEGVKVERIILMGYQEQEVVGAPAGVVVERHDRGSPGSSPPYVYAYAEGDQYKQVQAALLTLTGLPVSTFTGSSRAPEAPIVLGPGNKDWCVRRVLSEAEGEYLQATALDRAQRRESIKSMKYEALVLQPSGAMVGQPPRPISSTASLARFEGADVVKGSIRALPGAQKLAVDPAGPTYYGISGQQILRVDLDRKTQTAMPVEGDLPSISWPGGITFDPKRRRLLIATQSVRGLLYSYEPDKNLWSLLREMDGAGLSSLSYSVEEDCLYGLSSALTGDASVIHRLSADGVSQEMKALPKRLPDERRGPLSTRQVVPLGANVAVLGGVGDEMRVMVIEWKSNTVLYDGPVKIREEIADAELQQMWEQLGTAPEDQATELVTKLASGGQRVVELIQKLPPVRVVDEQTLRGLITKLDHQDFRERDGAAMALRRAGEGAVIALKDALAASPSPEARARIESLLKAQEAMDPSMVDSPELQREIRAMRVLGEVGSTQAVRALREFATEGGMGIRARAAREALRAM
jgi:hypothetical protein